MPDLDELIETVIAMGNIPDNWDSYGAPTPSTMAINSAIVVLNYFNQVKMLPTDVSPSCEGGICLSIATDDKYADMECFNDGTILAACTKLPTPNTSMMIWHVPANAIRDSIDTIHYFLNRIEPKITEGE